MPRSAFSSSNSIWRMVASVSAIIVPNPLPPHGAPLRLRVLELQPVWRTPRSVTRSQPLGDNALAAELTGVLEDRQTAIVLKVLVQADAMAAISKDTGQGRLADLDRLVPQVGPV